MPGQDHYGRAEAQPACARAEPSQQIDRGRHLAIAGEVVLDDESAVKAERFGLDIVIDEVAEALAAVELGAAAPCCRTAEETELPPSYLRRQAARVSGVLKPGASSRANRRPPVP